MNYKKDFRCCGVKSGNLTGKGYPTKLAQYCLSYGLFILEQEDRRGQGEFNYTLPVSLPER